MFFVHLLPVEVHSTERLMYLFPVGEAPNGASQGRKQIVNVNGGVFSDGTSHLAMIVGEELRHVGAENTSNDRGQIQTLTDAVHFLSFETLYFRFPAHLLEILNRFHKVVRWDDIV